MVMHSSIRKEKISSMSLDFGFQKKCEHPDLYLVHLNNQFGVKNFVDTVVF